MHDSAPWPCIVLAADRDVAPGEALVSLPAACLITYATAMESDLVRVCV